MRRDEGIPPYGRPGGRGRPVWPDICPATGKLAKKKAEVPPGPLLLFGVLVVQASRPRWPERSNSISFALSGAMQAFSTQKLRAPRRI